jgi:hypothetical protein
MGVLSWQEVTRQMPQSCTFCKCCLVHSVHGHNMDVKNIAAGWYWWQVWCCNFWIMVQSSVAIARSGSVLWYLEFTDLISALLYPPSNSCWASICNTPKYLPTQGGKSLCLHTYWFTGENGHLNWSVSKDLCAHGSFRPWQLDYDLFWLHRSTAA